MKNAIADDESEYDVGEPEEEQIPQPKVSRSCILYCTTFAPLSLQITTFSSVPERKIHVYTTFTSSPKTIALFCPLSVAFVLTRSLA